MLKTGDLVTRSDFFRRAGESSMIAVVLSERIQNPAVKMYTLLRGDKIIQYKAACMAGLDIELERVEP